MFNFNKVPNIKIPVDKIKKPELFDHAAYLMMYPLKDGGARLRKIRLRIIKEWDV